MVGVCVCVCVCVTFTKVNRKLSNMHWLFCKAIKSCAIGPRAKTNTKKNKRTNDEKMVATTQLNATERK